MNKNTVKTVRINDKILKLLKSEGWTVQKLFDWAVSRKVQVETTIKLKSAKGKK